MITGTLENCENFPGLLQINGESIISVYPNTCQTNADLELRDARAKYILKIWNCHADLLEALKTLVDEGFREVERMTWAADMLKIAQQAIAKAESEV